MLYYEIYLTPTGCGGQGLIVGEIVFFKIFPFISKQFKK